MPPPAPLTKTSPTSPSSSARAHAGRAPPTAAGCCARSASPEICRVAAGRVAFAAVPSGPDRRQGGRPDERPASVSEPHGGSTMTERISQRPIPLDPPEQFARGEVVAAARCPVDVSTYPRRHVIVVKHAGDRQTFPVHEVAHHHVEWLARDITTWAPPTLCAAWPRRQRSGHDNLRRAPGVWACREPQRPEREMKPRHPKNAEHTAVPASRGSRSIGWCMPAGSFASRCSQAGPAADFEPGDVPDHSRQVPLHITVKATPPSGQRACDQQASPQPSWCDTRAPDNRSRYEIPRRRRHVAGHLEERQR